MKYSLNKYKFFQKVRKDGAHEVIAVSSYAGRAVKGYAKCDPRDTFDEAKGKELAAARCNEKISAKRVMRATQKYMEAVKEVELAQKHLDAMRTYYMDSVDQHDEAASHLEALSKEM